MDQVLRLIKLWGRTVICEAVDIPCIVFCLPCLRGSLGIILALCQIYSPYVEEHINCLILISLTNEFL